MPTSTTTTLTPVQDRLLTKLAPEPWQLRENRNEPEVPAEHFEKMGTPLEIRLASPLRLSWFRKPVSSMMLWVGWSSV